MNYNDWSLIQLNNLAYVKHLQEDAPMERGRFGYDKKGKLSSWDKDEGQVGGSLSRYNHPKYKQLHYGIKNIVEQVIGEKLYPTYHFDRFYFKGQDLERHVDRGACEVSVSMHISTNADYDWPISFELENGEVHDLITKPGDAVLYKGHLLPHWREPLKGDLNTYYHQIFFHYVRRDGSFVQYAYDNCISS